jgi:hypothetical protein
MKLCNLPLHFVNPFIFSFLNQKIIIFQIVTQLLEFSLWLFFIVPSWVSSCCNNLCWYSFNFYVFVSWFWYLIKLLILKWDHKLHILFLIILHTVLHTSKDWCSHSHRLGCLVCQNRRSHRHTYWRLVCEDWSSHCHRCGPLVFWCVEDANISC